MSAIRARNILLTGGGGFVSSHLLNAFDPGSQVTVHVRDVTKLAKAKTGAGLNFISGPLTGGELLKKIPVDCDVVLHLAGAVHGRNVEAVIDSNVVTTKNVLDFMQARGIKRLVFMSTAAVWSGATGARLSEQTEPKPTTLYGFAKLSAERLVSDAINQGRIGSAVVLRCNNTYGPGGFQGAVANFFGRLSRGLPVQIEGDGQQLREPLYVADLVSALMLSMSQSDGLHTYGISGAEARTVLSIAQTIAQVLGRELDIEWVPDNPERARHLMIDTARARQELGWTPRVSFEDGCRLCANSLN